MNLEEQDPIFLKVENVGHIPSFKNTKSLFKNRKTGNMFIATDPRKKKIMEKITQSFVSQLYHTYQTSAQGMRMGLSLQSWIALYLPLDDSWQWIRENGAERVEIASKGSEGAFIRIDRISSLPME